MIKKLHIMFVAFLAFSAVTTAQNYPTSSWSDLADVSWYVDTQEQFTITTAEELAGVAQLVEGGNTFTGKTLNIGSNIDLNGHLWSPIGKNVDFPFSGAVEGGNYTVSNLWINIPQGDFVGLFGQCTNSSFKDILVDTSHIIARDTAGTLVGNLSTNSTMENCHVSNTSITGSGFNVGGLVGGILTNSNISTSSSSGDVVGENQIGGLVGTAWDLTAISECYTEGTVSGGYLIGGLVGYCTYAFIPNRTNSLDNSYSRATVTASLGRAGGVYGGGDGALAISNTYSTGAVTAPEFAGGFIGVYGPGGIDIINSYFDTETSGTMEAVGGFLGAPVSYGIEGKTTAEMKTAELVTLLNAGSTDNVWSIDPSLNDGYPILNNLLSVDNVTANPISVVVYPTVFDSSIHVSSKLDLEFYSLYSVSGTLVSEGSLRNVSSIELSELSSGLYILKIDTLKGSLVKKVIKK